MTLTCSVSSFDTQCSDLFRKSSCHPTGPGLCLLLNCGLLGIFFTEQSTMSAAMSSSQGLGLLTVIAVSGSVIILALGRHKLLMEPKPPHHEYSSQEGQNEANSYSRRSCLSSGKKCSRKKKVRFAEDVVEPCGDNEEYRRRHTLAMNRRLSTPETNTENSTSPFGVISRDKSRMNCEEDVKAWRRTDSDAMKISQKKLKALPKPNIPANRMALYNGMLQYRMHNTPIY
eukprot:Gb_04729 [translate_table: standard]